MITAKEAKELYDNSGAEVQEFLKYKVEKYVREAAILGKKSYTIHLGSEEIWKVIKPSPLQTQIMHELKNLGYVVNFTAYDVSYVPAGLADDEGKGPVHRNYGITIGW